MAINDFYKVAALEVIKDIYGTPHYMSEVKVAPKHKLKIYLGRPIHDTRGGRKIILTPELASFVKNTLDMRHTDIELPIASGTFSLLRREIHLNPYKNYQAWLNAPDKPRYITFDSPLDNPETINDYFEEEYILYSARMSPMGIPILMGMPEKMPTSGVSRRGRIIHILTPELAAVIIDYRLKPYALFCKTKIKKQCLKALREKLGFNMFTDRNVWFAERIDDLIALKPTQFFNLHGHYSYDKETFKPIASKRMPSLISLVSAPVKLIIRMRTSQSKKNIELLRLLENNWQLTSETTREAVDSFFDKSYESERFRRGYQVLKLAGRL